MLHSATRDDTICNQCTRHCGVRVFDLDKNFSETGKTAIWYEFNNDFQYVCFSGKVLWRDWGSTRSGMPGLQWHALTPVVSNFMWQLNQVCPGFPWHALFCCHLRIQSGWHTTYMYFWCKRLDFTWRDLPGRAHTYLHECWWMSWQEGVWKYTGLCQAIVLDVSGKEWIQPGIHVEYAAYGE